MWWFHFRFSSIKVPKSLNTLVEGNLMLFILKSGMIQDVFFRKMYLNRKQVVGIFKVVTADPNKHQKELEFKCHFCSD